MKRLFLVALTLFIAMFASAQENRVVLSEENLTFKANDDFTEVTITGVKSNGTDFSGKVVEFPSAIQGVPVTTIKSCGIWGIAGIFIPEGVKTLGESAFSETSAKSVHLPESLETIGEEAFYKSQLTSINLPTKLREIGDKAFYGCAKLEAIEIPKNCKIRDVAFGASGIKKLKLPAGNVFFEDDPEYGSFLDCDNLEKIEIPEGFIFISKYGGRYGRRTLDNVITGATINKSFALQKQLKAVKALEPYEIYKEGEEAASAAYDEALEKEDYDEAKKIAEQFIDEHSFFPQFQSSLWNGKVSAIVKIKANSEYNTAISTGNYADAAKIVFDLAKNSDAEYEKDTLLRIAYNASFYAKDYETAFKVAEKGYKNIYNAEWKKRENDVLVAEYNAAFEAKDYETAFKVAERGYENIYNDRDEWKKRENDVLVAEYNTAFEAKDYETALQVAEKNIYDDEWKNRKQAVLDVYVIEPFMRDLETKGVVDGSQYAISVKNYYDYGKLKIGYGNGNNSIKLDSESFLEKFNELTGYTYKLEGEGYSYDYKLVRSATETEKAEFAKQQELAKKARNDAKILEAFNNGNLKSNIYFSFYLETKYDDGEEVISKVDKDSIFAKSGLLKKDIIKEILFTDAEGKTRKVEHSEFKKLMAPGTLTFTVLRGKKKNQQELKITVPVEWDKYDLYILKLE